MARAITVLKMDALASAPDNGHRCLACNLTQPLTLFRGLTLRITGRRKQAKRRFRLSGACAGWAAWPSVNVHARHHSQPAVATNK